MASTEQDINSLDNSVPDEDCSDGMEDEGQYLKHGWVSVHQMAERLGLASQAFHLSSYARVNIDDMRWCLKLSRLLIRERDARLVNDQLAVLEFSSILSSSVQLTLSNTDRILKLDRNPATCVAKVFRVAVEYTIFITSLLDHLSPADLNSTNLESQALVQCASTMQTLLWPGSALHTDILEPRQVVQQMTDGYQAKLRVMCRSCQQPNGLAPDVEDLAVTSCQALLTDLFCRLGGLDWLSLIIDKLAPTNLSMLLHLLSMLAEMDGSVLCAAHARTVRAEPDPADDSSANELDFKPLDQALQSLGLKLLDQIRTDPEKLAERERAFVLLSRVFDAMYTVRCMLLGDTDAVKLQVDRDMTRMQQQFIQGMLRSTNFNNLLSAARECQRVLQRAEELVKSDYGVALKMSEVWLEEHNVIQTLLKANLHQRQYADLVLSILQVLTKWGYMRTEHLDMLWSVTEAEGTFDVVKANVYCMIQDLAGNLEPMLLEQLFKKFDVLAQGCSVADSMRLLDLLKKLATSNTAKPESPDSTNVTADRLLALIWKLTMPADAPTELLACDAMADVLGQYGGSGHRLYCKQYLGRCCQELVCHQNVYTALRVMRRLLALYELFDQQQQQAAHEAGGGGGADRESLLHLVLWELDTEFNLQKLLVDNLLHLMEQARAWVHTHGVPSPRRVSQTGADTTHMLRLPGHGLHSYSVVLGEYLQTISYVASKQKSYYDQEWVEQLWDALVMHPVLPSDVEMGLGFLQDGASPQYSEFFSHATKAALLNTRITNLPPGPVSPAAWQVFQQYFYKVNLEEKLLAVVAAHDGSMGGADAGGLNVPGAKSLAEVEVMSVDQLHGCEFIWKVALEADHPDVAQQAAELLIQVYIKGSKGVDQSSNATATFIKLCTAACMPSALALAGLDTLTQWGPLNDVSASLPGPPTAGPPPAASDVRNVQRCVFLLCQAAEAGQSCFQGIQWEFDIHVQGANPQARRIRSLAAPEDYVGTVRRTLGSELGCGPQYLRLLHAGVEWKNDAHTLCKVMQRPDQPRQLVQAAISPVPNSYTQPGPDYAARWQSTALSLLSNEPHMYHMLLYMAEQAQWPELCKHAMRLLQLLPTCTAVPAALVTALQQPAQQATHDLQQLLLGSYASPVVGDSCGQATKQSAHPLALARLLYWLQSLHGLLFPAKRLQDWLDTQDACKPETIREDISTALPDLPAPSTLLPSMAHCLSVLQQVLQCSGSVVQCGGGMQRLFQVLELQGQLVQLLANLSRKDVIQLMQQVCKGCNPVRPLPLEVLLCSPANSPSIGCASAHNLATTPTGALQALTMATGDADTDSSMTGGDAVAVAQVTAASRALHPRSTDAAPGSLETSPGWVDMEVSGAGRADRALTPAPAESPAVLLVGLLVHSSWQAANLATGTVLSELSARPAAPAPATAPGLQPETELPSLAQAALSEAAQVVRDGLGTLCRLLHGSPELYSAFLTNSTSSLLIPDLLLNTHSSQLRIVGAKALRDICLSHQGPALTATYVWLLKQLVACRSAAIQCTAANKEYFALLLEVVNMLPQVQEAHNHPVPCELASQLLREELVMLHACMSTSSASVACYQDTMQESEGCAPPHVVHVDEVPPGSVTLGTDAGQQELQGRLSLVTGLIKALGRGADGDTEQKALIKLLLTRYLFPEAVVHKLVQDNVRVPPAQLQAVMAYCATEPATRQAAFELLLELMSSCSNNMACGTEHLMDLHFSKCGSCIPKLMERKGEGIELLRTPDSYCGLRNGGATCYMNSVVQQLFMQPRVRSMLLGSQPVPAADAPESLYAQLQMLMAQLALSCAGSVRPDGFWHAMKDYDDQPINLREHQDAYEFFTRLQDSVDSHLKSTGQPAALAAVFGGTWACQCMSREGPHRSEREEEFYQISVDVKGKGTLQNSLTSYVQGELMEGENAWFVEELNRKVQATRRTCFKQLPQSLIIHLKRFEYDHIQNQRVKVKERFEFPQVLDMYPYTAEGLAASDSAAAAAAAGAAAGALDDDATMTGAEAEQGVAPPVQHLYELRGVVVHSGSAFAGHYYSFIKERPHVQVQADGQAVPTQAGKWFSFDDRTVRPWDVSQLDEQCYGGRQTSQSGTTTSSTDSNQTSSDERAFSAYLLFYDRIDGSCVEYDPVPSYLPASPPQLTDPVQTQSQDQRLAVSTGGAAGEQLSESTAASGCGEQAAAAAVIAGASAVMQAAGAGAPAVHATPYGMPQDMHEQVLCNNLQLVRRMRAFEKDYIVFVRKVCELRLERVASGRKARRTRLLDAGDEAPQSSGEASHALASSGATALTEPSPTALLGISQDAAAQRDVDRVRACEEVMTLGLELVLHVLMHAPSAIQMAELEQWQPVLQKLLGQSVSVAVRAVDTLLSDPEQVRTVQNILLSGLRSLWLVRFLDSLQQHLVAYSNQACSRAAQELATQPANQQEHMAMAMLQAMEPVAAHARLLEHLALSPLYNQYQLLVSHHNQRHRRGAVTRAMQQAMEQPFHQHLHCMRLLGTALALRAPAINLLDVHWSSLVVKAVKEIAAVWTDNRQEFVSADYTSDFTAAVGCMVQILLHVDDIETVYRIDSSIMDANDPRACPTHDPNLHIICARNLGYPDHLPAPLDPGPVLSFAPYIQIEPQVLPVGKHAVGDTEALLQAMFAPNTLLQGSNVYLLHLLSWNDSQFSWEVVVHYLRYLQGPELESIETDPQFLLSICQPASILLQIPDNLQEQRLAAVLMLPNGGSQLNIAHPGIVAMLESDDEYCQYAGWFALASLISPRRLEAMVDCNMRMLLSANRGRVQLEPLLRVLFINTNVTSTLGDVHGHVYKWKDGGDLQLRQYKSRTLTLMGTAWQLHQSLLAKFSQAQQLLQQQQERLRQEQEAQQAQQQQAQEQDMDAQQPQPGTPRQSDTGAGAGSQAGAEQEVSASTSRQQQQQSNQGSSP